MHWPFCVSKCPYCDFNVHVRPEVDHARWRDAYLNALAHYAEMLPDHHVRSIFFGGGTPSLMAPDTVAAIIEAVQSLWPCEDALEITLEANPTSVEFGKFQAFADAGVNRVSLGVQSLHDEALQFLGRSHNRAEALQAIETAARVFPRFSFDLMYARPGQSLEDWRAELEEALRYAGEHLSLYQLTIERQTPFYWDHIQGKFHMPDDHLASNFYLLTQQVMADAGLPGYEISNHARSGAESRHNLIYWRYEDYVGIGPGAHGRIRFPDGRKAATRDHRAPEIWLERVAQHGFAYNALDFLTPDTQFLEALMMGLRLRDGVAIADLEAHGGRPFAVLCDMKKLKVAENEGWVEEHDGRLVATSAGRLRLDSLVPFLIGA